MDSSLHPDPLFLRRQEEIFQLLFEIGDWLWFGATTNEKSKIANRKWKISSYPIRQANLSLSFSRSNKLQ
jgi:hypothetical protein